MMVSDSGQTEHLCCCEVVNTHYALCIAAVSYRFSLWPTSHYRLTSENGQ